MHLTSCHLPSYIYISQTNRLSDEHKKGIEAGTARKRISGYSTSGYKFDADEMKSELKKKGRVKQSLELQAGIINVDDVLEERMEAKKEEKRK